MYTNVALAERGATCIVPNNIPNFPCESALNWDIGSTKANTEWRSTCQGADCNGIFFTVNFPLAIVPKAFCFASR